MPEIDMEGGKEGQLSMTGKGKTRLPAREEEPLCEKKNSQL